MTWKTVTTVSLGCGHLTYYRGAAAPSIGDIVKCPTCRLEGVVKITNTIQRTYPKKGPA